MTINVFQWMLSRQACNASRRRRFSTDAARAHYYAAARARRFASRISGEHQHRIPSPAQSPNQAS